MNDLWGKYLGVKYATRIVGERMMMMEDTIIGYLFWNIDWRNREFGLASHNLGGKGRDTMKGVSNQSS